MLTSRITYYLLLSLVVAFLFAAPLLIGFLNTNLRVSSWTSPKSPSWMSHKMPFWMSVKGYEMLHWLGNTGYVSGNDGLRGKIETWRELALVNVITAQKERERAMVEGMCGLEGEAEVGMDGVEGGLIELRDEEDEEGSEAVMVE
jgi:hypothetical protein